MTRWLWRSFLGLVRVGLAWIPAFLLAAWGAAYVRACVVTALAPGNAVVLRYESSAGVVTVRADSYIANIQTRTLYLRGVSIVAPDGVTAGRATEAVVTQADTGASVKLKSVEATVERDASGNLNVKDLLPKPSGQPDTGKVEVTVDRAVLVFRDMTLAEPLVHRFVVKDLALARADGDTLLSAEIEGATKVSAWAKAGGEWAADTRLLGGDFGWLIQPASTFLPKEVTKMYGPIRAASLTGKGNIHLSGRDGKVSVTGDVAFRAGGVSVGKTIRGAMVDAEIHGGLDRARAKVSIREANRRIQFEGVVAAKAKSPEINGNFAVSLRSRGDVWPELAGPLPKDLKWDHAVYSGSLRWDGSDFAVAGDIKADGVELGGLKFGKLSAMLGVTPRRIGLYANNFEFSGLTWRGRFDLDTKTGGLNGLAETQDDLARVLPSASARSLSLPGHAQIIVRGTVDHPKAVLDSTGVLAWCPNGEPSVELGKLSARATLDGDRVVIDRCLLIGNAGAAKVTGTIDVKNQTLDLAASVPGVRIGAFTKMADGNLAADLRVIGPFDHWLVAGRVEGYGVETQGLTIPQIVAEFSGDDKAVDFSDVRAHVLGGHASAKGRVDVEHSALDLEFNAQDLDIGRLSQDQIVGQVDLHDGRLTGTFDHPVVRASADSVGLVAGDVRATDIVADLNVDGALASCVVTRAKVGDGLLTVDGSVDLETMASSAAGEWRGVRLSSLKPKALDMVTEGTTSGRFAWQDPGFGQPVGEATVNIDGASLNHLELGSGDGKIAFDGRHLLATGSVGTIDRYVQLNSLDYNVDDNTLDATGVVSEFGLRQAVVAALAQSDDVDDDTRDLVNSLGGNVSASISVSGRPDALVFTVPRLTVNDVTALGHGFGSAVARGKFGDGAWSLDSLVWSKGDAHINGALAVDRANNLAGLIEVVGVEMADVAALIPGLDIAKGTASGAVLLAGKPDAPEARGSAKLDRVTLVDGTGKPVDIPLSVNASEIDWRNGLMAAAGDFTVATGQVQGGVTGSFQLRLPTVGWGLDRNRAVGVDATLDNRPLAAFGGLWPEIEEAGTNGTVSAEVHVSSKLGDIQLGGNIKVGADEQGRSTLKLKSSPKPLENVLAEASLSGQSARVTASASGPFGGSAKLTAMIDAKGALSQAFSPDNLISATELDGALSLENLQWRGKINGADKDSTFTVNGDVTAKGPVSEPTVGGRLQLKGVALNLPSGVEQGPPPTKPLLDPVFDNVTVVTDHGTQVNVAAASVNVYGTGSLTGSLSDPRFTADLGLDSGTLRLPTNRITLEDSSRIRILAEGPQPTVRVDVDLTGHTVATARQATDVYQTYLIALDIKGNLVGEEPLQITGTSDPPDLTNDQIRAILGEQQLIESLARGALGQATSSDLRDSFYSVAVPSLTAGLTDNLAQGLKLDYLVLDYNPFDQAVLRLGKSLGKGLMLQASRQLVQPTFGPIKYEFRLSYRPPFKDQFFSRIRFSLSHDQEVPWKIGVGWSFRF